MTDPKVTLTDEQWAYIKRHEDERTREANRHYATMQQLMADAVALVTKSHSDEDKRDWFASQALTALGAPRPLNDETMANAADWAYRFADHMLVARKTQHDLPETKS